MEDVEDMRVFSKHKQTTYVAHKADADGFVHYTDEENNTWHTLFERQIKIIEGRACDEFATGVSLLEMTSKTVPQVPEINRKLRAQTGWQVEPVNALIPHDEFFNLLTNKKFPAATFIRRPDELDYLQEPDIFHEFFGHCPMLTVQDYADFMQEYGRLALTANHAQQKLLARLYWFTVEFGLINSDSGPLSYGGGILSSKSETIYAVESDTPERKPFDLITVLRTPYRIDMLQTIYFVIDSYHDLYNFMNAELLDTIDEAIALGDFEPTFPTDDLID